MLIALHDYSVSNDPETFTCHTPTYELLHTRKSSKYPDKIAFFVLTVDNLDCSLNLWTTKI